MTHERQDELAELHLLIRQTRRTVKSLLSQARAANQFLARLDEHLEATRPHTAPEAQSNGSQERALARSR